MIEVSIVIFYNFKIIFWTLDYFFLVFGNLIRPCDNEKSISLHYFYHCVSGSYSLPAKKNSQRYKPNI